MKPTIRPSNITPSPRPLSEQGTPELRIDPPHSASVDSNSADYLEEDQGVDLTAADLDTLPDWQRRQINQLARLMRDRQMELDRREAELNARMANFESQQRSAALSMDEPLPHSVKPSAQPSQPKSSSASPLRNIEETIRGWRRKWRGQSTEIPEVEPEIHDSITVRLEKLSEAESQLAQQWALLKNARSLQALREKEFAGYTQKVEREMEQSRAQQHLWLEQEQLQLSRDQEELARRENELADVQQEMQYAFEELQLIRDQLEMAWAEIRVRIPSALRRRLDQQTDSAVDHFDKALHARNQAAKAEIRQMLHQLELAKLEIQEQHVQLEDNADQHHTEIRRAKHDLSDREAQVRAQLAELRREHESLNDTKLEILKERYQDLSREITPKAA
ncbi:hypothetical protein C5Y96_12630 [Blastopirellula marina]|uniref:Uncharacterized protein n=1 Tax=Blastopirellula marina TaxID=124 RepID=A0A2S8FG84_9BACT|nr:MULTISPECIES: hypothetical protein [Pirellulaceae]PQO31188.1 hypothetical protein C5Y96_12630 [Blastopirellula marina]RCS51582.1 hypothetical protein DTL36_12640 [Bremerella cremea]